jgi:hypothetical protein
LTAETEVYIDYSAGKFTLCVGDDTAVENVEVENASAIKKIVNGQMVIEKDGKFFNLLGAEVK